MQKEDYLVPGMIDGHIHSECSKLSITSYAKAVVPHGTTSMISGLDEYISVSDLDGLQEIFAEVKQSPLKVFWGAPYKTPYTVPKSTVSFNFTKEVHQDGAEMAGMLRRMGDRNENSCRKRMKTLWAQSQKHGKNQPAGIRMCTYGIR